MSNKVILPSGTFEVPKSTIVEEISTELFQSFMCESSNCTGIQCSDCAFSDKERIKEFLLNQNLTKINLVSE